MKEQTQIDLIKQFSDAYGVPGFEQDVVRLYRDQMKPYADVKIDGMFNALAARKQNRGNRPVVQMDAHADEVGFMVQAIRPSGLIKFVTLGGWVPTNVPAMRVVVRNKRGEYVPGVVATKPPHFMTAAERNAVPTIAGMSIDVGSTSREETLEDYAIDTGCPIFPDVKCEYDAKHGMFFGKAFDDRIGAAALIDTFDNLKDDDLAVDVVAGLSTQEEVGLRGAYVTARKVDPDIAIVYEGVPADDTFEPDWLSQTRVKAGRCCVIWIRPTSPTRTSSSLRPTSPTSFICRTPGPSGRVGDRMEQRLATGKACQPSLSAFPCAMSTPLIHLPR